MADDDPSQPNNAMSLFQPPMYTPTIHPTSVHDAFCVSTLRYVIYADEIRDQRRGCLMDFLPEPLPAEPTREYYHLSYMDFLGLASDGREIQPQGWTAIVDNSRVSFNGYST